MKKERIIVGFIGVWLIILAFFGFPSFIHKILIIVTGFFLAFVSFWRWVNENVDKID